MKDKGNGSKYIEFDDKIRNILINDCTELTSDMIIALKNCK